MSFFSENMISKIKSYSPWAGLFILTVSLMIYFKNNSQGIESFQNKGEMLVAKYTGNLTPLFAKSELTNEDVFNFALYNTLPIDKENNKALKLEPDSYGNENFVVTKLEANEPTKNLSVYKSKFDLNKKEENQIDSILNSYKNNIYASILINNTEAIALDPKISMLHKAIGADIYKFTRAKLISDGELTNKKNYALENRDKLMAALNKDESNESRDYIFLTPDTVFTYNFAIDKKKMADDIRKIDESNGKYKTSFNGDMGIVTKNPRTIFEQPKPNQKEYIYTVDSNFSRLTVPSSYYTMGKYPDYDSLKLSLGNLAEDIEGFEFGVKNYGKGIKIYVSGSDGRKKENVELDLNFENLGNFISSTITTATQSADYDWDKFGTKMDSLSRVFDALENDSNAVIKLKKITEELKKAKESMRKKNKNTP